MTPREPMTARSVRVPTALWKAALVKADERGDVLAEIIRDALEAYVEEE